MCIRDSTTTSSSDGYVTTTFRYRGYHTTTTFQGSDQPNGNSGLGSINDNQDADYFANAVIDVLYTKGEVNFTNALRIQIGNNGTITNNDTAFKSVSIDGTVFNRSDCTFSQNNGADRPLSLWTISASGTTPSDASNAMGPFPGAGLGITIVFRRSR